MRGIVINEDVENYENDVWKGFSGRQLFSFLAVSTCLTIILVAYFVCYVPIQGAIYLGIPFGIFFGLMGFLKIDDMTLTEYIKELWRLYHQAPLCYQSGEYDGDLETSRKKVAAIKAEDAAIAKAEKTELKKSKKRKNTKKKKYRGKKIY